MSASAIYGGTFNLFGVTMKKLGIDVTFIDQDASEEDTCSKFPANAIAIFSGLKYLSKQSKISSLFT